MTRQIQFIYNIFNDFKAFAFQEIYFILLGYFFNNFNLILNIKVLLEKSLLYCDIYLCLELPHLVASFHLKKNKKGLY